MKISESVRRYEEEYLSIKGVNENQLIHTRALGRLWCEIIGDMELSNVTLEDVAKFRRQLQTYGQKRCNNTIHNYISDLRMVLKYWRARGEDCLEYSIIPTPRKDPVIPPYLTSEEVDAIIARSSLVRTKFVISILYASGIRVSELTQLNRDTIKDGVFTVIGKGRKPRICFLDERSKYYMEMYLNERTDRSEALVVARNGQRVGAGTIQMIVRNATEQAGIHKKVSPHTLRHSFATNYVSNGGSIRHLAELLGHSSVQTTAHYTHIVNNDLMRAYRLYHTF